MSILTLLKTRRSVKPVEMTGPGPSLDELDSLLTIAARVPDHGKLVPWRFIILKDEARHAYGEILARLFAADHPDATPEQIAFERKRFARAPLVIAVVSRTMPHQKITEWEQVLSAGAAAMNLLTAAHGMGYAGCWLTEWPAYDRRALDALGLAASEKIAGFVYIGKAAHAPEDRPRPNLPDIVTIFGKS